MSFVFERDDKAAVANSQGGGVESGVHDVVIRGAWLGTTQKGNNTIDLELETKTGGRCTIFGMCLDKKWTSGAENSNYATWQELVAISGMTTGATAVGDRVLKKKGVETKEQQAYFTELVGKELKVCIRVVHDVRSDGAGTFQSRELFQTYNSDGTTLAEKAAGSPAKKIERAKSIKDKETEAFKNFSGAGTNAASTPTAEPTQENVGSDEDLL